MSCVDTMLPILVDPTPQPLLSLRCPDTETLSGKRRSWKSIKRNKLKISRCDDVLREEIRERWKIVRDTAVKRRALDVWLIDSPLHGKRPLLRNFKACFGEEQGVIQHHKRKKKIKEYGQILTNGVQYINERRYRLGWKPYTLCMNARPLLLPKDMDVERPNCIAVQESCNDIQLHGKNLLLEQATQQDLEEWLMK